VNLYALTAGRLDPRRAQAEGFLSHGDDLISVRREVVDDGPARGCRSVTLQVAGGLQTRVLLDRGMDLGATCFSGTPISWRSAVGEAPAGRVDAGQGWLDGWEGGLLTTCGLRNVGAPGEGHGQHGSFTDLAARDVHVARRWLPDGEAAVDITGTLDDASSLGSHLQVVRCITVRTGSGQVTVTDRTTNCGPVREQAPFLYHVNFGYPFLTPSSELGLDAARSVRADDGSAAPPEQWRVMGRPLLEGPDTILEHEFVGDPAIGQVDVSGPAVGLTARVSWDRRTLPRLHTWRRRTPGSYVTSVEPANCSLGGRVVDRQARNAPFLEPGEERLTSLTITVKALPL
jgi:hypothetical protein